MYASFGSCCEAVVVCQAIAQGTSCLSDAKPEPCWDDQFESKILVLWFVLVRRFFEISEQTSNSATEPENLN